MARGSSEGVGERGGGRGNERGGSRTSSFTLHARSGSRNPSYPVMLWTWGPLDSSHQRYPSLGIHSLPPRTATARFTPQTTDK